MPSVMVHKVSATLTDDAQYKDFNEIPTTALASGSVVELMPGTYAAIASGNTAGVTLRGVGSPASVVIPSVTISSGTTGVACVNTSRRFIGIEKDEKYFYIAKDRIESIKK